MPRIGLLSDSHGRAAITQQGVKALLAEGVDLLIHLGDIGSVEVIDELVAVDPQTQQPVPARLVFGNSDWDIGPLGTYAQSLGIHVDHPVGRLELNPGTPGPPGTLIFCHGHEHQAMAQALAEDPAYLCHGHTHQAADTRSGLTRVVNPGALCRAHRYTVAVLDTEKDDIKFLTIAPNSQAANR